jgi:hypothetical protein
LCQRDASSSGQEKPTHSNGGCLRVILPLPETFFHGVTTHTPLAIHFAPIQSPESQQDVQAIQVNSEATGGINCG